MDFNLVFIIISACNFYFKMSSIYFPKDGEALPNPMKCYNKICSASTSGFIIRETQTTCPKDNLPSCTGVRYQNETKFLYFRTLWKSGIVYFVYWKSTKHMTESVVLVNKVFVKNHHFPCILYFIKALFLSTEICGIRQFRMLPYVCHNS